MSTKSDIYYNRPDEEHTADVHVYYEYYDGLVYLEIRCSTCTQGIRVPIPHHLVESFVGMFKEGEVCLNNIPPKRDWPK